MGAITLDTDGNVSPIGPGAWHEVGVKVLPNGSSLGGADPWWHINFRTENDLRELAMKAAQAGDIDIATGMQEIASYFITDAEGKIKSPDVPLVVWL